MTETLKLTIPQDKLQALNAQGYEHKAVIMGIRPEDIHPESQQENSVAAKISVAELTGAEFMLYTTIGGHELVVRAGAVNDYYAGDNITIHFDMAKCHFFDAESEDSIYGIWNLYTLNNGGAFMAPEPDDDDDETWVLFNAMNGNRAEMSPEAAGIAACLMTYIHHACRTECYAMTVHYYRLRDYALQHPECSAIMRIID